MCGNVINGARFHTRARESKSHGSATNIAALINFSKMSPFRGAAAAFDASVDTRAAKSRALFLLNDYDRSSLGDHQPVPQAIKGPACLFGGAVPSWKDANGMKRHHRALRKWGLSPPCDHGIRMTFFDLMCSPRNRVKARGTCGRETGCLSASVTFYRDMACGGMGGIFEAGPWTDKATV